MKKPTRPTSVLGSIVALVLGFAFIGIVSSCAITIGIWPGQVKLLAPIFCTDAQPDAFVVADTYSPQPGETVTNFSLYCMGPRGDATDHGFMKPFLLISVVNGVAIVALLMLFGLLGRGAARRRLSPDGSPILETIDHDHSDTADAEDRSEADRFVTKISAPPPGSTKGPFVD